MDVYIRANGSDSGPWPVDHVLGCYERGELAEDALCWIRDGRDWRPLVDLFEHATIPSPPPDTSINPPPPVLPSPSESSPKYPKLRSTLQPPPEGSYSDLASTIPPPPDSDLYPAATPLSPPPPAAESSPASPKLSDAILPPRLSRNRPGAATMVMPAVRVRRAFTAMEKYLGAALFVAILVLTPLVVRKWVSDQPEPEIVVTPLAPLAGPQ